MRAIATFFRIVSFGLAFAACIAAAAVLLSQVKNSHQNCVRIADAVACIFR
jgi:hypothetical protein